MCNVWHDDEMMDLGDAGMLAMEREIIWTLLAPCLMLAESSQLNVIILYGQSNYLLAVKVNRYKERTYFGRHTCVTCHDTETVRHEKSIPTSVQSQSDKTISSLAASPLIGISPPYS